MRHSGIAEHGRPIPANHGRACLRQCFGRQADGAGQVVMPRGDVGDHRAEGVEGRFAAPLELFVHVFLDQVQRHAARAFVHDLHAVCPSAAGEFSLHFAVRRIEPGRWRRQSNRGAGRRTDADDDFNSTGLKRFKFNSS